MQTWKWLYNPETTFNWRFIRNVVIKTALLFVILNVAFAFSNPVPTLGRISIYNMLVPGRERLPYGENSEVAYNLSLYQIDAMFASHKLDNADHDAYRVLLIGDSSVWGILLEPEETLAGWINSGNHETADGQRVRAYNLGYPTMSLAKDLMLLDYAMRYEPDLIVWLITLESFGEYAQLESAIVKNNSDRVKSLITDYELDQDVNDSRFSDESFWDKTIVKQRRALADLLRLQFYGAPWAVTGIDQEYRDDYQPRSVDLSDSEYWQDFRAKEPYTPETFTADNLAFDVLMAGEELAGDTPMLFINEPIYISDGENSDVRYNAFFPRWAYDEYRVLLAEQAESYGWELLDLWDAMPQVECYTDSPVHLTSECSARLSDMVSEAISIMAENGTVSVVGR
jgi:hypothetical protein